MAAWGVRLLLVTVVDVEELHLTLPYSAKRRGCLKQQASVLCVLCIVRPPVLAEPCDVGGSAFANESAAEKN